MMAHKHHILPKYKGGSNNPDNLVEVGVTQHAMFHYCNWQLWGNEKDWLAWKGLSAQIGQDEILRMKSSLGGKTGGSKGGKANKGKTKSKEHKEKLSTHLSKVRSRGVSNALSEQSRQKKKETFKQNKHSQGERNSQYGTMWITNGEINKKIRKNDPIPEGYYKGRKLK